MYNKDYESALKYTYEEENEEELRPGMLTKNGGVHEPEDEPDLNEYLINKAISSSSTNENTEYIDKGTGYLLDDGRTVPMGSHSERMLDHRYMIPSSNAMRKWNWPDHIIKQNDEYTRTPAMLELMKRSGAARIMFHDNHLAIHIQKPLTKRQKNTLFEAYKNHKPKMLTLTLPNNKEIEDEAVLHHILG